MSCEYALNALRSVVVVNHVGLFVFASNGLFAAADHIVFFAEQTQLRVYCYYYKFIIYWSAKS